MNIIVDAFGGDNAPLEVIKGCRMAQENLGIDITLTGNKNIIAKTAADNGIDISGMIIEHSDVYKRQELFRGLREKLSK